MADIASSNHLPFPDTVQSGNSKDTVASNSADGVSVSVKSLVSVFEKDSSSVKKETAAIRLHSIRRCINADIVTSSDAASLDVLFRGRVQNQSTLSPSSKNDVRRKAVDLAAGSSAHVKEVLPDVVMCSTFKPSAVKRYQVHSVQRSAETQPHLSSLSLSPSSHVGCPSTSHVPVDAENHHCLDECQDDIPSTTLFTAVKNIFEKRHTNQLRHHRHQYQPRHSAADRQNPHKHQDVHRSSNVHRKLSPISYGETTDPRHRTASEIDRQIRIRLRKSLVDAHSTNMSLALPSSWRDEAWKRRRGSNDTMDAAAASGSVGRLTDLFNAKVTALVAVNDTHNADRTMCDNVIHDAPTDTAVSPMSTALNGIDAEPPSSLPDRKVSLLSAPSAPRGGFVVKLTDVLEEEANPKKDIVDLLTGDALNLSAPKQRVQLRQRGSLANRRKPSRSSLRASSSHCMYDVIPSDATGTATEPRRPRACQGFPVNKMNTLPYNNHHKQQLQRQDVDVQPTWMTKALVRRRHQQLSPLVDTAVAVVDTSRVITLPLDAYHQQSTDAELSMYHNCVKNKSNGSSGGGDKSMIIDQVAETPTSLWMKELRTRLKHTGKLTASADD